MLFLQKQQLMTIECSQEHLLTQIKQSLELASFKNYVFQAKKSFWTFQIQPKIFQPFGNNSAALAISIKELTPKKIELSISEAYPYLLPALILMMVLIGIFYGIFLTNFLPLIGILIAGMGLYFYNQLVQRSLKRKFLEAV